MAGCDSLIRNFGYADHSPVSVSVPPGSDLGCNPSVSSQPTVAGVQATVTASDDHGPLPASAISVSETSTTNGCLITTVFTATATGTCGDQNTATATYTWTINTTPPSITLASGVTSGDLGCNPTTLPTSDSISNSVTVTASCSSPAAYTVTSADTTSGCLLTRIFTIQAADGCNNSATLSLTNTWTVDTAAPTITGAPTGSNLGCNPATTPLDADVKAQVTASVRLRRTDDQRVACGWRNTLRGDADLYDYSDGRLQSEQREHDGGLHLDGGHGRADDYGRANRQQLGLQSCDDAFGCGCEGASDG